MATGPARRRRGLGLRTCAATALAGVVFGGCVADAPQQSTWPPDDYYVEVRYQEDRRERQRVRFWRDGLVVYAEATDWLGEGDDGGVALPVFSRISAYQLRPESIRYLSRLLERAGLNDLSGELVDAGDGSSPMVTIHWRAFRREADAWVAGRVEGSAVRVLQVINAFLPLGCSFDCAGLSVGDPEPSHLVEVPEPEDSVSGALGFYREALLRWREPSADLAIEAFALALEAKELDVAEELLQRIEADTLDVEGDWWVLPSSERPGLALSLRLLLERRRRAAEKGN